MNRTYVPYLQDFLPVNTVDETIKPMSVMLHYVIQPLEVGWVVLLSWASEPVREMQNHNPGLSDFKANSLNYCAPQKELPRDLLAFLSLFFLPLRQANRDSNSFMDICLQIIIFKTGHDPNWAGKKVDRALHTQPDSLLQYWQPGQTTGQGH